MTRLARRNKSRRINRLKKLGYLWFDGKKWKKYTFESFNVTINKEGYS